MIFRTFLDRWTDFTEILAVLHIPYEATNAIQKSSYTLSDFFVCWLRIEHKLKKLLENAVKTDLAEKLTDRLAERKKDLFQHPAMMAAIYLDPRVRGGLSNEEIIIAKYKLENLRARVQEMKKRNETNTVVNTGLDASTTENLFNDSFDQYLASRAGVTHQPSVNEHANEEEDFFLLLDKFDKSTPYQNTSILAFWESQKDIHPTLYELACILYSIPPSQATVERSFSILKFIFTCKRHKLKTKMLEDILLIKLNENMIQAINQRDIDDERNKLSEIVYN